MQCSNPLGMMMKSPGSNQTFQLSIIARRAYCAVTPKICVRPVSVRSFVRPSVRPVLDAKGHFPVFLQYHSQNASERCPTDHCWDPKIRRFRNRKPAFSDSKKFPKSDHFWIRTCFLATTGIEELIFREPLHRQFGPPCPAGVI